MTEQSCPKCGYGIMEVVLKVEIEGVWEKGDQLEVTQTQKRIWRCIDCLSELEIDDESEAAL